MKFSRIAALARKYKTAVIMLDADEMQWLSVGCAVYRLERMPWLDEETVLTLIGVADNSREKWNARGNGKVSEVLNNDLPEDEEITAEDAGISIVYGGKLLTPIYTMEGVIWFDVELLSPAEKKDEGYRRFFVRPMKDGHRAIAIKDGFILTALILEYETKDTDLENAISTLDDRCRSERATREKDERVCEVEGE